MPPAVIAAGVAAAGSIGGALLSSDSQKSATQQATQATTNAQNQATQAQLQLGQQSLDLQRQMYNNNTGLQTSIYNQDFGMLSPFATNGMVASNAVNALLGLPGATPIKSTVTAPAQISAPTSTTPSTSNALASSPTMAQIQALQHDGIPGDYKAALAQYGMSPQSSGGGIPALVSPVGALLTGGGI